MKYNKIAIGVGILLIVVAVLIVCYKKHGEKYKPVKSFYYSPISDCIANCMFAWNGTDMATESTCRDQCGESSGITVRY